MLFIANYGVWDERQAALQGHIPEVVSTNPAHSTLRQLPKYLPALLSGAIITVELSVLAMAVAMSVGLVWCCCGFMVLRP